MTRRVRFLAALLSLFALLFAQWAVASYRCADLGSAAIMAASAQMDGDASDDALCQRHCDEGKFSSDPAAHPAPMALGEPAPLRVASAAAIAAERFDVAAAVPAPAASPPKLRHTVLRH